MVSRWWCLSFQNLDTMLIKTPDLIEAMIELACSRRWLQTTIYVIEFSQHVLQGLWLEDSSLMQVRLSMFTRCCTPSYTPFHVYM